MPFSDEEMTGMETLLREAANLPQAVAQFHCLFPGKSVTRCDLSDMGAESAYRHFEAFDLYLVDGRDHCWRITGDPAAATGIVLARRAAGSAAMPSAGLAALPAQAYTRSRAAA